MNPFQMCGRKIVKTHARKNVRRVVFALTSRWQYNLSQMLHVWMIYLHLMNNLPHARGDVGRYSPHGASGYLNSCDTVDGSELLHQLSLVVYPIIYDGFYTSNRWLALGFLVAINSIMSQWCRSLSQWHQKNWWGLRTPFVFWVMKFL